MTERETDIDQTEIAVVMRHHPRRASETAVSKEAIFAPVALAKAGVELADLIGRRIAEAPGYAMVFMQKQVPHGPERDAFIARVEAASRMQAGVGFALLFPVDG